MSVIVYQSVQQLATKLKEELTQEEFKELIHHLVKNNVMQFQEFRKDGIPKGSYAPVVKVCVACGRPV